MYLPPFLATLEPPSLPAQAPGVWNLPFSSYLASVDITTTGQSQLLMKEEQRGKEGQTH
jgi:hypothetical protein